MAYENNHYIPQFILREYGDRINVFNVKDHTLKRDQKTYSVFAEKSIYPPDLEKDIGYKLEAPFAKLFHNKLMQGSHGEKITVTRKELLLMKRFFLLEMMRVEAEKANIPSGKVFSQLSLGGDFTEKEIPGETTESRWHRNLRVIIETEDLRDISKHEFCTYEVLRWSKIFLSGYFAFWDCSSSNTDFLISDIGMTSEREDSVLTEGYEHEKKDYLDYLIRRETRIDKREVYKQILQNQFSFHENFYMFPLSKKRMIVIMNPFFRLYDKKEKLNQPSIWPTHIENKRLFEKNVSPNVMVLLGKPMLKDNDEFTYTIQGISDKDAEWVNMLMLDRVDTIMGFDSFDRIKNSVKRYIDFHTEKNMKPPVDYSFLLTR